MSDPVGQVAGFVGWRYHETAGTNKHGPTLDKPQTKFWRFNRTWWGVLATSEQSDTDGLSIFRFDEQTQSFIEAGEAVTRTPLATADVHIDGNDLFIATRGPGVGIELLHLHFDESLERFVSSKEGTWRLPGVESPSVSVTTSKDGMIVLTFATDRPFYVAAPKTSFPDLGEPICIPGASAGLLDVDLSAAIAVDDDVALLWSDQRQES